MVRAHSSASPTESMMPSEPGRIGTPTFFIAARALFFFAHHARHFRRRPDDDAAGLHHLGEVGVLAQQSVTGMDGVDVGNFGSANHSGHVEIAIAQPWWPDADGLVGKAHMQRVAVGFAIDRNRLDAQFLAGADDAQGYLATIRNEDFLEHE